jgi:hypothetical protein
VPAGDGSDFLIAGEEIFKSFILTEFPKILIGDEEIARPT